ncbi:techylectin-5B-like isoform X6 [Mytilus californianus]|uniref:techylectin-5B-like isoform X6 n=1 Tax=Mytilus californianus TaxID=6549 RepID=UPI002246DAB0|nr:techylectin-5B-like isoform X6 [Mytilus californianus]
MIDTLFVFLNVLIILMVAIYVNHTERLILQLKEDVRKSLQLERVSEEKPIDCTDIHVSQGSGIYTIYPKGIGRINVYCDLDTYNNGGGWTVFQRRETGEEDFNREWIDYENGFGSLRKEFWLGNSKLYIITEQGDSLRRNNNRPFTTKDRRNIKFTDNKCEIYEEGPWWLQESCFGANLNGKYLKEKSVYYGGNYWYDWQKSYKVTLQKTTMMIRRIL